MPRPSPSTNGPTTSWRGTPTELSFSTTSAANEELGRTNAAIESFRRFLSTAPGNAPYRDLAERRLRELELRAELQGSAPPSGDVPDATPDAGSGVSPIAIAILSVGGAALLAGVITGSIALTEDAAVADGCDDAGVCPVDSRPRAEQAQALANATDALLFGGGAIALTGMVLLLVLEEGSTDETNARIACSPTACVAALWGSF